MAHSVNLCLQDCAKPSRPDRDALALMKELYNLIQLSPKPLAWFNRLKDELAPQNPTPKPLCPTRWTVRTAAIDTVLKNYALLYPELEKINEDSSGEGSTKAAGLLPLMEKFSTYFNLKLSYLAFVATEQLAITLQGKDVNAQVTISAVNATKSFLQRQRSTESFNTFYQSAVVESQSQKLTSEPLLSRQSSQYQSVEAYFRQQYFEVLDILNNELERRFDQESLKLLIEIERLLVDACNGNAGQPSRTLQELCESEIDFKRLEAQLAMLPDLVKTVNLQSVSQGQVVIRQVIAISTVCDIMNSSFFGKSMFSEVYELLRIYLTVPMTSASAERTFSTLRYGGPEVQYTNTNTHTQNTNRNTQNTNTNTQTQIEIRKHK